MRLFFILFLFYWSGFAANSAAPVVEPGVEEILVTATRTSRQGGYSGSSHQVLDRQTIESSGETSLVELLKSVPGVFVKQNGGTGAVSSVSLRGIPYKYTLVLVDGMKLADYMGNGGSGFPVLDHLSLEEVQRVEIVYGSQSTLWGSDAVGGVIQIFTRRGKGKKKLWLSQEFGTHGSYKTSLGLRGASLKQDYSLFVSRHDVDGFSEALRVNPNLFGGQREDDGYANLSARLNLGFQHDSGADTRLRVHSVRSKKDIDGFFDGNGPADQKSRSQTSDLYLRLEHNRPAQDGDFEDRFSFSSARFDSENFIDSVSAFGPFSQYTRFNGSVKTLNWQRDYYLENQVLSLGWELEQNFGSSLIDEGLKNTVTAYYLQNQWDFGELSLVLGARRDQHSGFGSRNTWKITPSFQRGKFRIFGSLGTGFKAPTIFELQSQQRFANNLNQLVLISNPDLKPATNRGYSIGFSRIIGLDSTMGITYFQNKIENTVDFIFPPFPQTTPFGFINLGKVETRGFEISLSSRINHKIRLNSNFSRSRAQEFPSGMQLRRQPRHQFKTNLIYELNSAETLSLDFRQNGGQVERYDSAFAAAQYVDTFRVFDLSYSKAVSKDGRWNLRIENLFNSGYQEVFGYDTGGRKLYVAYTHSF